MKGLSSTIIISPIFRQFVPIVLQQINLDSLIEHSITFKLNIY